MAEYQYSIDIEAPSEVVWTVLTDVGRWPDWHPAVSEAKLLNSEVLGLRSEALLRQPRLRAARWTVDDLQPGSRFGWTSTTAGVTSRGSHEVGSTATGSHVHLVFTQSGPLALLAHLFYGTLIRTYLRQEAEGLKRRAEQLSG